MELWDRRTVRRRFLFWLPLWIEGALAYTNEREWTVIVTVPHSYLSLVWSIAQLPSCDGLHALIKLNFLLLKFSIFFNYSEEIFLLERLVLMTLVSSSFTNPKWSHSNPWFKLFCFPENVYLLIFRNIHPSFMSPIWYAS